MLQLLIGLALFLGIHSLQSLAPQVRENSMARWGALGFKAVYAAVALLGLYLLVQGYGQARLEPVVLWTSPVWVRHLASLLTLLAFVLLAAAYVPRNTIKARLRHPMVLGVKAWALAHLVANSMLADLLLFGGFLLWAVLSFRAARARDRAAGTVYPAGQAGATALTVVVGLAAWAFFAFWAHQAWIGVRPFG